jgi:hypothetical protein
MDRRLRWTMRAAYFASGFHVFLARRQFDGSAGPFIFVACAWVALTAILKQKCDSLRFG